MVKYYAVRVGRDIGIYTSWKECEKQVKCYSGAEYKSFTCKKEAQKWIDEGNESSEEEEEYSEEEEDIIKVYTDGACSNNGTPYAKAGIGVYFGEGDERNFAGRVRGKQTNNVAELKAVIKAFKILKKEINTGKKIILYTDSSYVIGSVGKRGEKLDRQGWTKDIPNKELVRRVFKLFEGKDNVEFRYIAAHTGLDDPDSLGNEGADRLATSVL